MERALWRDIGRFYHADLKNLCGPFDRSYGMDMQKYVALAGAWIAFYVPPEKAPLLPPSAQPVKSHEFPALPGYALVAAPPPKDVMPHLRAFQGKRRLSRPIGASGVRVATAWLGERIMIGGGAPPQHRTATNQAHPATVHWMLPNGDAGWVRFVCDARVQAAAGENTLHITVRLDEPPRGAEAFAFRIEAPDIAQDAFSPEHWKLPGLVVRLEMDCNGFEVKQGSTSSTVQYTIPEALRDKAFTVRLRTHVTD